MPASLSPGLRKAKRRSPRPAVWPAESTDVMAQARRPGSAWPRAWAVEPKWSSQEVWPGEVRPAFLFRPGTASPCSQGGWGLLQKWNGEIGAKFLSFCPVGCVLCCGMKTDER